MASNLALYAENKSLELLVGKTAFATPTTYIGLFTVIPDENGAGGTEASLGNYARIVTAGADWEAAAAGAIQNANDLTFAEATGAAWGLIVGIGIWDAITAGNMIFWISLIGNKQVDIGDTFRLEAGEIDITAA
ncbi:hypothetical protein LCGC14_0737210 [marine sediment metagenome]|uniref:Uncharacterized protein n=1 Tax=marine sediment metagenome TaxID=412755 RepID=A0A0F9TEZ2_9ZZZZ